MRDTFLTLFAIIMVISGPFVVIKPQMAYKIIESWKSYKPSEPSDLYIMHVRIGGIIYTLVGLAYIITLFL